MISFTILHGLALRMMNIKGNRTQLKTIEDICVYWCSIIFNCILHTFQVLRQSIQSKTHVELMDKLFIRLIFVVDQIKAVNIAPSVF